METDAQPCTHVLATVVTQPDALIANTTSQNVLCNGQANGSATVLVTGGIPPYSYLWSSGVSSATISNLSQGTYTIIITDANGCTLNSSVAITQPSAISVNLSPDPTICIGQNATLTASASGGMPPYVFKWNTGYVGPTLQVAPSLTATYNVYITDQNGCNSPLRYGTVNVNPALMLVTSNDDTLCQGQSTTLYATPSGGNGGPYTVSWNVQSSPATSITVSPANTTVYYATVTDGCTVQPAVANATVVVNQLPQVYFEPLQT